MKLQKLQKTVFVLFTLLMVTSLILYSIFADEFSAKALRQSIGDFGVWAPLVFILLYTIGTIFIPSTPFMLASGILFGFTYGLIYTLIGGFLSSILVFIFARKLGKSWVESILQNKHLKHVNIYNRRLAGNGLLDLIILRIAPIMPFNILNIIMGISKISLRNYIIGTVFGLLPSVGATVYAGTLLSKIL